MSQTYMSQTYMLNNALQNGESLDRIEQLLKNGYPTDEETFMCGLKLNNTSILRLLSNYNCPLNSKAWNYTFENKLSDSLLFWLRDNKCPSTSDIYLSAIKRDTYRHIEWVCEHLHCPFDKKSMPAAIKHSLQTVKLFVDKGCPVTWKDFVQAANTKDKEMIEYFTSLIEKKIPRDVNIINALAQIGNLELVQKFLTDKHCDKFTMSMAIRSGNKELVTRLYKIKCPMSPEPFTMMVHSKNLRLAIYLRDLTVLGKDTVKDKQALQTAARLGELEIMKWLLENGWELDVNVFNHAAKSESGNSIEILEWLIKNKCPHNFLHAYQSAKNKKVRKWIYDEAGDDVNKVIDNLIKIREDKLKVVKWKPVTKIPIKAVPVYDGVLHVPFKKDDTHMELHPGEYVLEETTISMISGNMDKMYLLAGTVPRFFDTKNHQNIWTKWRLRCPCFDEETKIQCGMELDIGRIINQIQNQSIRTKLVIKIKKHTERLLRSKYINHVNGVVCGFCKDPGFLEGIARLVNEDLRGSSVFKPNNVLNCRECNTCGKIWCTKCGIEYFKQVSPHDDVSCDVAQSLQGVTNPTEYLIKKICKKCPGCQSNIEKKGGCNDMRCKQCNTRFCWWCMKTMDEPGSHEACQFKGVPDSER